MSNDQDVSGSRIMSLKDITVCPGCDLILATSPIPVPYGSRLVCPRCGFRLRSPKKDPLSRTFVLSLTGLILFVPAHFMILLTMETLGMQGHSSVFNSIVSLYRQQYGFVAFIVLLTAQIFPLLKLGLLCSVTLGISRGFSARLLPLLMRWYHHLQEWSMSEIYLIAILVTVIKMSHTVRVTYNVGFICFTGLVMVMTSLSLVVDRPYFWQRIEQLLARHRPDDDDTDAVQFHADALRGKTAMSVGLVQCRVCRKVFPHRAPETGHHLRCPRCVARVHWRIPDSVPITWALVLTAIILSFPANLLPIMNLHFLGSPDQSTIMDGITYFFQDGSYGIGLIILTASILVPVCKIIGLMVLLYSIRMHRTTRLLQKSVMFRCIEFIGRWSMLDIFVITLLGALVNFGFFTSIRAAPAATFFTWVVLTTMFAAISFDQRLLWDAAALEYQTIGRN